GRPTIRNAGSPGPMRTPDGHLGGAGGVTEEACPVRAIRVRRSGAQAPRASPARAREAFSAPRNPPAARGQVDRTTPRAAPAGCARCPAPASRATLRRSARSAPRTASYRSCEENVTVRCTNFGRRRHYRAPPSGTVLATIGWQRTKSLKKIRKNPGTGDATFREQFSSTNLEGVLDA